MYRTFVIFYKFCANDLTTTVLYIKITVSYKGCIDTGVAYRRC